MKKSRWSHSFFIFLKSGYHISTIFFVVLGYEDQDRHWIKDIERIVALPTAPALLHSKICRKCSYYDFCYIDEVPD